MENEILMFLNSAKYDCVEKCKVLEIEISFLDKLIKDISEKVKESQPIDYETTILSKAVLMVMGETEVSSGDISETLLSKGYKSTSKNFRGVVRCTLSALRARCLVKKVGKDLWMKKRSEENE